jgi:hypothetical protein
MRVGVRLEAAGCQAKLLRVGRGMPCQTVVSRPRITVCQPNFSHFPLESSPVAGA